MAECILQTLKIIFTISIKSPGGDYPLKRVWNVDVNGARHVVELKHGYMSGKTVINVDGSTVVQYRKLLGKGSRYSFQVDGQAFLLWIKPKGFSFHYNLTACSESEVKDMCLEEKAYEKYEREGAIRSSASWFFWIAGLSILNTVISLTNGMWNFLVGLQVTQFVDAIAMEIGNDTMSIIAVIVNLLFAGIFLFIGIMAYKRKAWAFITGVALYALDGLLFLISFDFISLAFHVYAIYCIYLGFRAIAKPIMEDQLVL